MTMKSWVAAWMGIMSKCCLRYSGWVRWWPNPTHKPFLVSLPPFRDNQIAFSGLLYLLIQIEMLLIGEICRDRRDQRLFKILVILVNFHTHSVICLWNCWHLTSSVEVEKGWPKALILVHLRCLLQTLSFECFGSFSPFLHRFVRLRSKLRKKSDLYVMLC